MNTALAQEEERPMTWPERLRAIADWLDKTNPILIQAFSLPQFDDHPTRPAAIQHLESCEMQDDLRVLALLIETRVLPEVPE